MAGVVSGCFRFNINGPMSVPSTVDDLGEAAISRAEGVVSTNSKFRGVCRQGSSL